MIYTCKNCGGNVVYSPERKKMYCPFCDGEDSEEVKNNVQRNICNNCGGELPIMQYTSATKCPHCDSYVIVEDRVQGAYEPQLVIPFKIGKEQVKEQLREKFKAKIFAPDSFLSEVQLDSIEGDYTPFFMFDYVSNYQYEGIGTKVRVWRTGNTEYTEHSEYQIIRQMDIDFKQIPADASEQMNDGVMDLLEPYQYEELEGFQPKYMSGFMGEVYNRPALEYEPRAAEKAAKDAKELMRSTITGYSNVIASQDQVNLKRNRIQYSLLPVWVYRYSFQGKEYPFYINGQTGKIVGNVPVSTAKVISYGVGFGVMVYAILQMAMNILEVL